LTINISYINVTILFLSAFLYLDNQTRIFASQK